MIAHLTGLDPWSVAGRLMEVWSWVDSESQTGRMKRHASVTLDIVAHVTGFAKAMQAAGWLVITETEIIFPHWGRLHSQAEKTRLLTAERNRKMRMRRHERDAASVTPGVTDASCNTETETKTDNIPPQRGRASDSPGGECPHDGDAADLPPGSPHPSPADVVPSDMIPDLGNLLGINAIDSGRLERVGQMIRDYGLPAVQHAVATLLRRERRSWSPNRTLGYLNGIARDWKPDEVAQPDRRVVQAVDAKRESDRVKEQRALAALVKYGKVKPPPSELVAQAQEVF